MYGYGYLQCGVEVVWDELWERLEGVSMPGLRI
jgi:hypothetical protein